MRLGWMIAAAAVALVSAAHAAPLEAYGKLPSIEDASLSPSGTRVAVIATDGENRGVGVQELATRKLILRAPAGATKVRAVKWVDDDHLLIVMSSTAQPMDVISVRREWSMGLLLDLKTGKIHRLLRDIDFGMNTINGMPEVRLVAGKPVVFVQGIRFVSNEGRAALFRIDLDDGSSKLLETGDRDTMRFLIGDEGRVVGREKYGRNTMRWSLEFKDGGDWREVRADTAQVDPPDVVGLSQDAKSIVIALEEGGRTVWQELRLPDGQLGPRLPIQDTQSPIIESETGRLTGVRELQGEDEVYSFYAPNEARIWRAIRKAFAGSGVRLDSWSRDRRQALVLVDSPTEGPAYAVADLNTGQATWLGAEYSGLKEADIASKSAIRFKARDGLDLTGYLTTPRGREAKGLPLVVIPHGGPAARDRPGYDWFAQGLASRGYAVLQVNFRGSAGLGDSLLSAGFGQWGRKMQTDLSDGVRELARQGIVDPKRVCVVGGSYGGYAALAGVTLDPGVYRCAASIGGVSDLTRYATTQRIRSGRGAERYLRRYLGAEDARDPVLAHLSPAFLADRADAPILLIHGKDDTVVPLEQSQVMADALRKAGKPVELIVQKGEDHWLSRGETRLQTLQAVVAFLEKHNPPS